MTSIRIITAVCWIIAAVVLLGLAAWFLFGSAVFGGSDGWHLGLRSGLEIESLTGPYNVVGTYSSGTQGVDSIVIDWIAGDVTVKPHDGTEIKITEYARRELREGEELQVSMSVPGSTLTIEYITSDGAGRRSIPSKRVEVLIPQELGSNLDMLIVDSTSADIDIEGLGASTIEADTMSGDIEISSVTAQVLDISSTSGGITINTAHSGDIKAGSMSGEIRISDSAAQSIVCDTTSGSISIFGAFDSAELESMSGEISLDNTAPQSTLDANTTSGSLELSGSFDSAELESMSGSISVKSAIMPSELNAETTSGSITIAVPGEREISVRYSTTSGKFSSDIPVIIQEDNAQFDLSALSGNIKIVTLTTG